MAYDHPYDKPARFPVQWVIRPANGATRPSEAATTAATPDSWRAERCASGEEVMVLPSGLRTRIAAIDTFEGELEEAHGADVADAAPRGRAGRLARRADLPRGGGTHGGSELQADVCWMTEQPAARRWTLCDQAHHARRDGDRRTSSRTSSTCTRWSAPALPSSWRSTTSAGCACAPALRSRSTPTCQPPHGQLHPDRRGHQRDGRRGDGRGSMRVPRTRGAAPSPEAHYPDPWEPRRHTPTPRTTIRTSGHTPALTRRRKFYAA